MVARHAVAVSDFWHDYSYWLQYYYLSQAIVMSPFPWVDFEFPPRFDYEALWIMGWWMTPMRNVSCVADMPFNIGLMNDMENDITTIEINDFNKLRIQ